MREINVITPNRDNSGIVTAPPLRSNVNDYDPTLNGPLILAQNIFRLETDGNGDKTITGLEVRQVLDTQWLINVGAIVSGPSQNILLAHEGVGSRAINRFITPNGNTYVLRPRETAFLWHDDEANRWRILYGTGA